MDAITTGQGKVPQGCPSAGFDPGTMTSRLVQEAAAEVAHAQNYYKSSDRGVVCGLKQRGYSGGEILRIVYRANWDYGRIAALLEEMGLDFIHYCPPGASH